MWLPSAFNLEAAEIQDILTGGGTKGIFMIGFKLYHKFKDNIKHDDYCHISKSNTANHGNEIELCSVRLHSVLF